MVDHWPARSWRSWASWVIYVVGVAWRRAAYRSRRVLGYARGSRKFGTGSIGRIEDGGGARFWCLLRRLAPRAGRAPAGAVAPARDATFCHGRSRSARGDAQRAIRGGRRAALFLPVLRRAADRVPRRGARALREVLRAAPLVQTPRRAKGSSRPASGERSRGARRIA